MAVVTVGTPTPDESPLARLAAAVDAVVGVAIDGLDGAALRAELEANEQRIRRLQARATELAAALAHRRGGRQ